MRPGATRSASYHAGVAIVGYLAAALGGALLGWLLCAVLLRRPERHHVPAESDTSRLAAEVVAESSNGYAVADADGNLLLTNTRAVALGVVRAGMPDERIAEAIERAAVSGELVDVEIGAVETAADLAAGPRSQPGAVHAVVRSIGDGLILVSASDESAAQRVEAVRRDFVANVSHELKTPVSAIALLAEAVLDGADDPETVRHFAGKLLREANRLGALVNELIALSRLQGADPLSDLAVVEVDAVVAEALGRVATAAESAGIAVTADAPSGLLVLGDRTLLVTAVANLIDNAVNYSPDLAPVTVSRRARDGMVEIAVTDRGIGIPTEHQQRVFERFFRIDPARSRMTGGTGLGLAIVKHVAANHGGSAGVWSRPGTGSTFTLRIPQVPATGGQDGGTAAGVAAGRPNQVADTVTRSAPAQRVGARAAADLPPVPVPGPATSDRGAL